LLPKFPQRNHIFYGDEHGIHRIAVLVSKEIFFAILQKRLLYENISFDATYDDLVQS
jgi:hypothetical protein